MSFVVAQISDTHLSADRPYFVENFLALANHLRDAQCDLVINTGDITIDGADSLTDLEAARAWHDGIGCDWLAIPGNHDIGDSQEITPRQPIADMRRIRYCEVFGPDWWSNDVPGWRLIGINAQLLGSDLKADANRTPSSRPLQRAPPARRSLCSFTSRFSMRIRPRRRSRIASLIPSHAIGSSADCRPDGCN